MNIRTILATAATLGVLAAAGAAGATSITLSGFGDPNTISPETMIADFNEGVNAPPFYTLNAYPTVDPNFSLALNGATVGYNEGGSGYSGTLFNDPTTYLTVIPGTTASLMAVGSAYLTTFSFYMGSPDTYNSIHLYGLGGFDQLVDGNTLVAYDTNQQWSWGKRVNLDFQGAKVTKIDFTSSGYSFELDNFAGTVGGVPEPTSWALMILGFGGVGAALRTRRKAVFA